MLTRSKRGALVQAQKSTKGEMLGLILVIAASIAFIAFFGLPGDPMHGASKYQQAENTKAGYAHKGEITSQYEDIRDF